MQKINTFFNSLSMYRLMLYYLYCLFGVVIIFSFLKILPFNPSDILISGFYIVSICYVANQIFGRILKIKPNFESQIITGFILALIVGPLPLLPNLLFLTLTPIVAMSSKYLINIGKQHVFNPAAFAVVVMAIIFGKGASWWIGSLVMFSFILLGGFLVVRKIHRFNLVLGFLLSYFLLILLTNTQNFSSYQNFLDILKNALIISPMLFFGFVMLTEPLTSPSSKKLRTYYGIFTAVVFFLLQRLSSVPYSLELSLLIANAAGRLTRFNTKYILVLKQKRETAPGIWEFHFEPLRQFQFVAGQFLEWSLPHSHADNRGTRRYFTIASSPTEKEILLAVKIPEKHSTFKSALKDLLLGESIDATSLEGDFTLPNNQEDNCVFIAGGIGITPFRSIIKYLLDTNKKQNITLFYSVHSPVEFVFQDIFSDAEKKLDIRSVYVVSENALRDWHGEVGRIDPEMIKKYVKDITQSRYYVSGPQSMVEGFEKMLKNMNVRKSHIRTDYFPGYTAI